MHSSPSIDPLKDQLLSDSQVARLLRVSPTTVWRYRTRGKRGVRLPAIPYGRRHVTTRTAIKWWFSELQRVTEQSETTSQSTTTLAPSLKADCEAAGI